MTQVPEPRTFNHRSLSPHKRAHDASPNEKFPSFDGNRPQFQTLQSAVAESPLDISPGPALSHELKWPARISSQRLRDGRNSGIYTHRPRRSVGDAINKFRTRQGSVSENAQELAEALKAPVSYKLIILCIIWYLTSALTNTSSKSILNALPKPATLTMVQFASVSLWCLFFTTLSSVFPPLKRAIPALKNGLRRPSWDVLYTAFPLSIFQLLGHLLSSYATSKIPVSLVHTIKGLSPLFTVLAYRVVFRIRYKRSTYLSLVPLTLGVMLACSTDFSTNFWGITASLVAAIVFVSQNIFSKKLFTESARVEADGQTHHPRKLDKLNLLCYCSVGAFLLSAPVWLYTEGSDLIKDMWSQGSVPLTERKNTMDHGELLMEYMFNGLFHFFQNIMAFVLLSMLSPVSYSVASLIKRVWVIVGAIIWFRSPTTAAQVVGIALTFLGLYLYDRTSVEDAAERRTRSDHFRHRAALLPVTEVQTPGIQDSYAIQDDYMGDMSESHPKRDDSRSRPTDASFPSGWLPPGTKQESTWEVGDQRQET
ncbi:hypothetical protein A1O1_01907 [Capronia coronata CBS 617.96]|uniref:Sugar phosphate transporter domain-containing protein n=1 Tax=Capronia coronata CBS 617.96 TaxID=1182541 RepID=W9YV13_9EURO|nr:uncharacterized protein A1O1_01907 [Capronia coronata CBS 617.96]EXJ93515.1 hypothetical protein A1O1_01907 [Capronia coronata CBS 617.96]